MSVAWKIFSVVALLAFFAAGLASAFEIVSTLATTGTEALSFGYGFTGSTFDPVELLQAAFAWYHAIMPPTVVDVVRGVLPYVAFLLVSLFGIRLMTRISA